MSTTLSPLPGGRAERRSWALFAAFLRISALAVGGGLTMLPLITREFVTKRAWMTEEEMLDCVAVVQSMPGIIGVNISVTAGYRIHGIRGVLASVAGMLLPPFLAILLIASCLMRFLNEVWVERAFLGVRAAVCALILLAAVKMGKAVLKDPFAWMVAGASFFVLVFLPQVNAIWVILGGAACGFLAAGVKVLRKIARGTGGGKS